MPPLTAASAAIRARNVSASEVGALMGKHPYMSEVDIFDRLTDPVAWELSRDPQSEAMALGVYFEPYIARYAAGKLGLKLRANSRTVEHPDVPLCATPDYLVLNARGLVEVKLSSIMYGWDEEHLAPHIEWQARAQMACTDREFVLIAALVGSRFYSIPVMRDEDKERRMLVRVHQLVGAVLSGNRPQEADAKAVGKVKIGAS